MLCIFHKWNGCKCSCCGETRTHAWYYNTCVFCGEVCEHEWADGKCIHCKCKQNREVRC